MGSAPAPFAASTTFLTSVYGNLLEALTKTVLPGERSPRSLKYCSNFARSWLVSSVLRLLQADLPVPHYSTLSRRAASLEVKLPRLTRGPLHLAIDSTGVKVYGEGEWKMRLHGKERRRTWRKLHLAVDHRTHEVISLSMTDKDTLDRAELPHLLKAAEGEVLEVLGDGAYDFEVCHAAIRKRGARAVIPPKKGAKVRGAPQFRDRDEAVVRSTEVGKEEWKKESGGDGHDENQDTVLREVESQGVEEAGDGTEVEVRGLESDDGIRYASGMCGVS
jgi:hypothetical protein